MKRLGLRILGINERSLLGERITAEEHFLGGKPPGTRTVGLCS